VTPQSSVGSTKSQRRKTIIVEAKEGINAQQRTPREEEK